MTSNLSHPKIITEDDHLIAVVKPAGLPTANAARGTPSVFTILQQSRPSGAFLGVVSRLDAPVSGVLVMAKTRPAAAELSRQFRERLVEKIYVAVVEGRFPAPLNEWVDWHDRIERRGEERLSRLLPPAGAVGRDPQDLQPDEASDDEDVSGGECHVRARVVKRLGEVSLVEPVPSTGRRHQLRAQPPLPDCRRQDVWRQAPVRGSSGICRRHRVACPQPRVCPSGHGDGCRAGG